MAMAEQGRSDVSSLVQNADALVQNVAGVVVARRELIEHSVVSVLAGGHLLLNDMPGVGKTLLARSLARSLGGSFKRIQFTLDLLPTDITGSSMMQQSGGEFRFIPGPIFANVVLADEINRASTRTQSALLESMQEKQISVGNRTIILAEPFCVMATQNPIEQEGTYPLPCQALDHASGYLAAMGAMIGLARRAQQGGSWRRRRETESRRRGWARRPTARPTTRSPLGRTRSIWCRTLCWKPRCPTLSWQPWSTCAKRSSRLWC